ncbi:hypothetical protein MSPP1_001926 [Malassezia sp. CBS 17886]|nr:hypothetical protein MSPP1_001926 [Malassezia sp. CBS 17886]
MPIPGSTAAPAVVHNPSLSPVELPTPPDDVALTTTVADAGKPVAAEPAAWIPPLLSHRAVEQKSASTMLAPLYRASPQDLAFPQRMSSMALASARRYPGHHALGLSGFRLSAERRGTLDADHAADDADMSVDDVFSPSARDDRGAARAIRAVHPDAEPPADMSSLASPPRSFDADCALPALDAGSERVRARTPRHDAHSLGTKPDTHACSSPLAEPYGRSPPLPVSSASVQARRNSFRGTEHGALSMAPAASATRRVPYSVPGRSPGSLGPFGQAYAMGMTPSHGSAGRTHGTRLPRHWVSGLFLPAGASSSRGAGMSPAEAAMHSVSAPSHGTLPMFDDDETDEEPVGMADDDATEDESDFATPRAPLQGRTLGRTVYGFSSTPSPPPAHGEMDFSTTYENDDYDYAAHREQRYKHAAGARAPLGLTYMQNAAVHSRRAARYATSLPAQTERFGAGGRAVYAGGVPLPAYTAQRSPPFGRTPPGAWSPDDAQRTQVHMAAAALDRLSMTPAMGDAHDEERAHRMRGDAFDGARYVDENDEVAAIRDRLGGAANCSAFISKLWHLMINPELYGKYIRWNEAGDTIILNNVPEVATEFAAEVLPKLFKHGNNASFVRQLNLYGFQRVSSSRLLDPIELQAVAAKGRHAPRGDDNAHAGTYNTAAELYGAHSSFAHPRFRRGQEAWLSSMKPRSSKKPKKPIAGGAPAGAVDAVAPAST